MITRLLIETRPGAGKTTAARRVVSILQEWGVPVQGFTTEEIREGDRRAGFAVPAVGGPRAVFAHVNLAGPPRIGRYGVDLKAFERVALPALGDPQADCVVVIDEVGKMELASAAFRGAVQRLLDTGCPLVATVHTVGGPFRRGSWHWLRKLLRRRRGVPIGAWSARQVSTRSQEQ